MNSTSNAAQIEAEQQPLHASNMYAFYISRIFIIPQSLKPNKRFKLHKI